VHPVAVLVENFRLGHADGAIRPKMGRASTRPTLSINAGSARPLSAIGADALRYIIKQPDTHNNTESRKLLYPWHPWHGRSVHRRPALPALTAEIHDMRTDHQILHHDTRATLEARGNRCRGVDNLILVDRELRLRAAAPNVSLSFRTAMCVILRIGVDRVSIERFLTNGCTVVTGAVLSHSETHDETRME
jgi:hypothetical protein